MAFVSEKPLDIFKEITDYLLTKRLGVFKEITIQFQSLFMATEPSEPKPNLLLTKTKWSFCLNITGPSPQHCDNINLKMKHKAMLSCDIHNYSSDWDGSV